jgi:inorganic phosphate transporter, PiT family
MAPRVAVAYAAILNFVGAFISLEVAATVAEDVLDPAALACSPCSAVWPGRSRWT